MDFELDLKSEDKEIFDAIERELHRQQNQITDGDAAHTRTRFIVLQNRPAGQQFLRTRRRVERQLRVFLQGRRHPLRNHLAHVRERLSLAQVAPANQSANATSL